MKNAEKTEILKITRADFVDRIPNWERPKIIQMSLGQIKPLVIHMERTTKMKLSDIEKY